MQLKDCWMVVERLGRDLTDDISFAIRDYVHKDDLEYNTMEELGIIRIIPYEEWIAADYIEMLMCELENANWHNQIPIPLIIINTLAEHDIPKDKINKIMEDICEKIYDLI